MPLASSTVPAGRNIDSVPSLTRHTDPSVEFVANASPSGATTMSLKAPPAPRRCPPAGRWRCRTARVRRPRWSRRRTRAGRPPRPRDVDARRPRVRPRRREAPRAGTCIAKSAARPVASTRMILPLKLPRNRARGTGSKAMPSGCRSRSAMVNAGVLRTVGGFAARMRATMRSKAVLPCSDQKARANEGSRPPGARLTASSSRGPRTSVLPPPRTSRVCRARRHHAAAGRASPRGASRDRPARRPRRRPTAARRQRADEGTRAHGRTVHDTACVGPGGERWDDPDATRGRPFWGMLAA